MDSSSGLSVDDKPSVDVKGKKCLDVGMASEEDIEGFLAEDGNNIVMILESGNAAVCIERDTVVQQLLNNTDNYYYLCRGEYEVKDGLLPTGVGSHNVCEIPVFGLGFLGLVSRGLLLRDNFVNAIENTKDQIFVIRHMEPAVKASAVTGVSYLRAGPSGQGTISSMHCQPDTGDELYYVTSENVDIVPADLKSTVDILMSAGCLVKKEDAPLTQFAYEGRPAPADVEDKLNELKKQKDFASAEVEGDDVSETGSFQGDEDNARLVTANSVFEDYLDTLMYSTEFNAYNEGVAEAIYESPEIMPELSPNANVAMSLRREATESLSPHAANYFVVLLGGLSRADSGLIVMQTSETDEEGGVDYLLKPIIKIEDFPPADPADGVAFSDQTLNILDSQRNLIATTIEEVINEVHEPTSETTHITPSVNESCVLMEQTQFFRKQEILMANLVCVDMSRILAEGGEGFDNDDIATAYYSAAAELKRASDEFLADSDPLREFVIPTLLPGMLLMQVKLSYLEPTFRVITTTATMGPDDAEPTKHTETAVLGNIFTYLAIPNVDDTSLLSSIGSLNNDSDNDSTDWSEYSDDDDDSAYYESGDEGPDAEDVINLLVEQVSYKRDSLLNSIALVISDGLDLGDTKSYVIGGDNLSNVIQEIKEPKSDTTTVMALIARSNSRGYTRTGTAKQSIYYIINPDSATRQEASNVIGYGIEVNNYPEYYDKSQEIFTTINFFAKDASAEFANLVRNIPDTVIPSKIEDPLIVIAVFENGDNMIELACVEVSTLLERMNSLSESEWVDYYKGLTERAVDRDVSENTTGNDDKISYVTIEYNEESGDPTNLAINYWGQSINGYDYQGVHEDVIGGVIGVTTFNMGELSEIENVSDDEQEWEVQEQGNISDTDNENDNENVGDN